MTRDRLLEWQWSDYVAKHQNRLNLLLHIGTVPLFQVGTLILLCAVVTASGWAALVGFTCMVGALAAQGRGHKLESEATPPFDGAADFITRFFAEQWVTFPRFVLSGWWYRNLTSRGNPTR